MGGFKVRYQPGIDQNIAANVRAYREAAGISQEELAQRMTGHGLGFSQATIWKIESGQRPVKAAELVALADSLEISTVTELTQEPDAARYTIQLDHAHWAAAAAYREVKEAAAAFLEAQVQLVFAAREARDAGFAVTELHTSWLTVLPEEAVVEARVDDADEATRSEKLSDAVVKVLDALRSNGYEPFLRMEDIEYHDSRPVPAPGPEQEQDS